MISPRSNWENHSDDDRGLTESLESCRAIYEADVSCLQYLTTAENRCLTTSRPNVGKSSAKTTSGWILERVQQFYDAAEECQGVDWIS
jgi:hypothetical protein